MKHSKMVLVALLLLFVFLGIQAQTYTPTNCSSVSAPQFAQSQNTSAVINGVTVTRTLTRELYSPGQAIDGCHPYYPAGYGWVRSSLVSCKSILCWC